jgi:hypothetical protein
VRHGVGEGCRCLGTDDCSFMVSAGILLQLDKKK